MIPFLAIAGTWAWNGSSKGQWYDPGSPFSANMRTRGFEHLHLECGDGRPFVWDTDVDGNQFWRRLIGKKPSVTGWQAAGTNLYDYCVPPFAPDRCVPPENLHAIGHSHGGQVILFAAADGLKINTLITVSSPIRADLTEIYRRARKNIGFWLHIHSDRSDRWQWMGEVGDGRFGIVRNHPFADQNNSYQDVGHSQILNDMRLFNDVWSGPLELIKERHGKPF